MTGQMLQFTGNDLQMRNMGNSRYCASGHIAKGSGSLLGDFFLPHTHTSRRPLAMFVVILCCHDWEGDAIGIWWVEAKHTANYPTMYRGAPPIVE